MNRLREARQAAGISALRLAEQAQTTELRVYAFERGERGRMRPKAAEAVRLAEALHSDPSELFPSGTQTEGEQ